MPDVDWPMGEAKWLTSDGGAAMTLLVTGLRRNAVAIRPAATRVLAVGQASLGFDTSGTVLVTVAKPLICPPL